MAKRTVGKKRTAAKKSTRAVRPAKSKATTRKTAKPKLTETKAGKATRPRPSAAAKERRARSLRAMKLYESGITQMQKHKFDVAAEKLRQVVDDYPEERDLHERARLYIVVCERQMAPKASAPETADQRIYAATLALNGGATDEALRHLDAAARDEPDSAHVQYMLAVAHALADQAEPAVTHLERAISLDADTRLLARQEPDFQSLHDDEHFQRVTASDEATGASD